MRKRDKILLAIVGTVVLVGGFFVLVIKPKRDEISKLDKQISDKQAQVDQARAQVQATQVGKYNYKATYATLAKLGKSAPPAESVDDDVPALLTQLQHASDATDTIWGIEIASSGATQGQGGTATTPSPETSPPPDQGAGGGSTTTAGDQAGAESASGTAAGAGASGGPAASGASAQATLTPLGVRLIFAGKFYDLEDAVHYVNSMTDISGRKKLTVKGRLVTIRAIKFTVESESQTGSATTTATTTPGVGSEADAAQAAREAARRARAAALNPTIKAEIFGYLYTLPGETSLFGTATDLGGAPQPNVPAQPGGGGGTQTTSAPAPTASTTVRRP
jgi:hypothetical protein